MTEYHDFVAAAAGALEVAKYMLLKHGLTHPVTIAAIKSTVETLRRLEAYERAMNDDEQERTE